MHRANPQNTAEVGVVLLLLLEQLKLEQLYLEQLKLKQLLCCYWTALVCLTTESVIPELSAPVSLIIKMIAPDNSAADDWVADISPAELTTKSPARQVINYLSL